MSTTSSFPVQKTCFTIIAKAQHKLVVIRSLLLFPWRCIFCQRHFCTKNIVYYCFFRRQDQTKAVLDSDCRQSCKVFAVLQSCHPPSRPMALCFIGHFHSELLNICRIKWISFHWKTYLRSWKRHRCVRHI